MNRALRRVSLICLVLFVLLLVNVNYVQGFEASSLANEPGNGRTFSAQFQFQRGSIVTADQKVIADSRLNKNFGEYQRRYPYGQVYAPVTGYDSLFSATGIEQAENKQLSGTDPALAVHNLIDLISGKPKKGATVQLTINSVAQQAAYNAIKAQGRQAGVVAINPQTGAILVLASYPTFDPNQYATLNGAKLDKNDARYRANPNQPLLNRAINVTFPPGSTFKVVTSSTLFSTGRYAPDTRVFAPTNLKLPGVSQPLINFDNEACNDGSNPTGHGTVPLIFAFTVSCNTVFGNLGMKVGGSKLQEEANLFGMNKANLTIPLPVTQSNFPLYTDPAQAAGGAIGQESDTVTPLQEAMFASAIADNGTLMKPYLVDKVTAPDLTTLSTTQPTALSHPVSPTAANDVKQMMVSVTQSSAGTAHFSADVPGIVIAGKTGTAQTGINNTGLDDAVFTCFAPASNPQIAVGVVVKGGGQGADASAPIAVAIIKAYLASLGKG
ncbi:MAG TPA: penicillin-binding transpeptidase domain-containing protein [Streptosporangiaceae bacterium]|nr:penicillin-binding transpeptidase domain-containing protein [Streptosporangiaceae bacterium]